MTPAQLADLFYEIIVSDEPQTEAEIARTHELAIKYGLGEGERRR